MTTIATAVDTPFTPAAGDFIVQCSTGVVALERSNDNDAPFVLVGYVSGNEAPIVSNPIAGARYRFVTISGTPVVQADQ